MAFGLAWVAASISSGILNLFGFGVHLSGTTILFPPGSKITGIAVENACSGIQSSTAFLAAYAIVTVDLATKLSRKKLLVLVALGPAMIYGTNLIRIVALTMVGYFWGPGPPRGHAHVP